MQHRFRQWMIRVKENSPPLLRKLARRQRASDTIILLQAGTEGRPRMIVHHREDPVVDQTLLVMIKDRISLLIEDIPLDRGLPTTEKSAEGILDQLTGEMKNLLRGRGNQRIPQLLLLLLLLLQSAKRKLYCKRNAILVRIHPIETERSLCQKGGIATCRKQTKRGRKFLLAWKLRRSWEFKKIPQNSQVDLLLHFLADLTNKTKMRLYEDNQLNRRNLSKRKKNTIRIRIALQNNNLKKRKKTEVKTKQRKRREMKTFHQKEIEATAAEEEIHQKIEEEQQRQTTRTGTTEEAMWKERKGVNKMEKIEEEVKVLKRRGRRTERLKRTLETEEAETVNMWIVKNVIIQRVGNETALQKADEETKRVIGMRKKEKRRRVEITLLAGKETKRISDVITRRAEITTKEEILPKASVNAVTRKTVGKMMVTVITVEIETKRKLRQPLTLKAVVRKQARWEHQVLRRNCGDQDRVLAEDTKREVPVRQVESLVG